jgi:hypothetical protein
MDAYKPSGVTPSGSNVNMGSSSYLPIANLTKPASGTISVGGMTLADTYSGPKGGAKGYEDWAKENNQAYKIAKEAEESGRGINIVDGLKSVGEFVGNEALGVDDFGWVAKNLAQGNLLEAGKSALAGGLELGGTVASVLGAIPSGGTSLGWFAAKQGAKKVAKETVEDVAERNVDDAFEAIIKKDKDLVKLDKADSSSPNNVDDAFNNLVNKDKDLRKIDAADVKSTQAIKNAKLRDDIQTAAQEAKDAKAAARQNAEIQRKTTTRSDRRFIKQAQREIDQMGKSTAELADDLFPFSRPGIKPTSTTGKGGFGKDGLGKGKGDGTGEGIGTGSGGLTGGGDRSRGYLGEEGLGGAPSAAAAKLKEAVGVGARGVDELPPPPRFGPMKPKTNPPKVLPGGTSTGEAVETTVEGALKSDPEDILNPNLMGPQFKNKVLGGLGLVGLTGAGLAVTSGTGAATSLTTSMGTAMTPKVNTPTTFADGTPKPPTGLQGGGGGGSLPTPTNAPSAAAPSDIPYIY